MSEELEMEFMRYGDIYIATVQEAPRLDLDNARDLGRMLEEYIDDHSPLHLLLSLRKVKYITSAALSEIIRAKRLCEEGGGSMRLCGVTEEPMKVLNVTNLAEAFHCHEPWQANIQDAAEHFIRAVRGAAHT